ncbi:MAG: tail fiber domain-containing protein, partial [Caldilineaceae bacterium]|nr:tail fiber domain-containing protein [Caldilineaceae bacterium]
YQGGHWTVTPTGIYYSGGNVGIGTSSPVYEFDVVASSIRIASPLSAGWSEIDLFSGRTVSDEKIWNIANNGSNGMLQFRALNDARTAALVEPLNILRNGNVGIGTVTPGAPLEVVSSGAFPSGIRVKGSDCPTLFFDQAGSGAYSMALHYCDTGNELRFGRHADSFGAWQANVFAMNMVSGNFTISGQGYQPGGGSWADSSDERLKHNIRPIAGALEKLARLQGVEFDWRKPKAHGNQPHSGGFIAQDVQQVFPEFITSEKCDAEECGLVDQGNVLKLSLPFVFDAYVVEAIKELKAENDNLRAVLQSHTEAIDALRAEVVSGK